MEKGNYPNSHTWATKQSWEPGSRADRNLQAFYTTIDGSNRELLEEEEKK